MRAILACTMILLGCGLALAQTINRGDRAKIRETRETMASLQLDLATVRQIGGEFPEALKGIVDSNLRETLPKDAWGRDFAYARSTEHGYKITSWGADGKAGGEGGSADIVWTQAGELREMSEQDRAAWQARMIELRFQASRAIARERMVVAGTEALNYHRTNGQWPAKLGDCTHTGDTKADAAVNACFSDPWGNALTFKALPKDNFAIVCFGADGKEDGQAHDADFVITERDVRATYNNYQDDWWGWDPWGNDGTDWRVQDLAQDVQRYKQRNGNLPEELSDLTRMGPPGPDGGAPAQAIRNTLPKDSYGNDYVYVKFGLEEFYIVALGKDGIQGGIKLNQDTVHPKPGTDPGDIGIDDDWGPGVVVPVPDTDEDELKAEIANELMLDIVAKCGASHADTGEWPASLTDIKDKFIDEIVPKDPWDAAFIYTLTKDGEKVTGFTLTCLGSNSAEGGEGHAQDIVYDQAGEPQAAAGEEEKDERKFR